MTNGPAFQQNVSISYNTELKYDYRQESIPFNDRREQVTRKDI